MIDNFSIYKLRHILYYDDKPLVLKSILQNLEEFATFGDVKNIYINSEDEESQAMINGQVRSVTSDDDKETVFDECLETNNTIVMANYEKYNRNTLELVQLLIDTFSPSDDQRCQATAHLYMGRKDSKSFDPHNDIPNNFIFQIEGSSRVIVYHNRCSTLMQSGFMKSSDRYDTIINRELSVAIDTVLEPGDCIYIPNKQFHLFQPQTDRISISIPIIGTEGWYGNNPKLETVI